MNAIRIGLASALMASAGYADVVNITDQTFLTSNWTLLNLGGTNVTGMTAARVVGAGITGDARRITISGSGSLTYLAESYKEDRLWVPLTDCVIESVTWEFWYRFRTPSEFASTAIVARQGDSYYRASSSVREPATQISTWQRHAGSFGVANFTKIRGPGPSSLDLSPDAPPIAFGYSCGASIFIPTPATHWLSLFVLDIQRSPHPLTLQPVPTTVCPGETATLEIEAAGAMLGYQWRRDGIPLSDGPTGSGSTIAGSSGPQLTVEMSSPSDDGVYDCVVSSSCGTVTSQGATLEVRHPADLTTTAVAGAPGYGVPDSVLSTQDFFYYLAEFAAGNLAVADLTTGSTPGQPGYGVPNGVLSNDDFFFYLELYASGC